LQRLADRKRYLEELQRAAFPAETQSGAVSVNRVSKTDSGHLFATHKTYRQAFHGYVDMPRHYYKGDIWASVTNGLHNPSSYTFGFPTGAQDDLLGVSQANRQGMANRYFASTAPDKNVGTLMTTLVELIRGDIPSVLKNFREMMAGYRSIRNLIGSDALNITFGWTPLIQEYANIIKVGMNLERVIYYESFRRKRHWDGPVRSQENDLEVALTNMDAPYSRNAQFLAPGDIPGPNYGYAHIYDAHRSQTDSENYHWSSKYTGLAKAGPRAESFSSQAMDVFKRLGLVDDPQVLWDLTPYSWLVDWFTTMGESIANANTYSPLTGKYSVDYAYMTTKRVQNIEADLIRLTSSPDAFKYLTVKVPKAFGISTTVWRERATPFGFGTQLGSLSASQFGILVALGLAQNR
jgi:hypothetical protein